MGRRARVAAAVVGGGVASGVFAGSGMGVAWVVRAARVEVDPWMPLRFVAAFWEGVQALVGGPATVLLGLGTHLGVSALLGVTFAALVRRDAPLGAAVAAGLLYATVVWVFMTQVMVPMVDPVLHQRIGWSNDAWYLSHLVFGLGLSVAPSARRAIEGDRHPAPAAATVSDAGRTT